MWLSLHIIMITRKTQVIYALNSFILSSFLLHLNWSWYWSIWERVFFIQSCSLFIYILYLLILSVLCYSGYTFSSTWLLILVEDALKSAKHALQSFFWSLGCICFIYPFVFCNLVIPFLSFSTCSSFCLSLSKFSTAFH